MKANIDWKKFPSQYIAKTKKKDDEIIFHWNLVVKQVVTTKAGPWLSEVLLVENLKKVEQFEKLENLKKVGKLEKKVGKIE